MNKKKQIELLKWLKEQSKPAKYWLYLSISLGIINTLLIIIHAWILATFLRVFIIDKLPREQFLLQFIFIIGVFILKAIVYFIRENVGFIFGKLVRQHIRNIILNKFDQLGPLWVKKKSTGSLVTIILEQIENIQDYYARYLPQTYLAIITPIMILLVIFQFHWIAALLLLITAPCIPLLMILLGMGAASANQKNFAALAQLSNRFLDSLHGLDTLRLFARVKKQIKNIEKATEAFRKRTMEVLRIAFFSSTVLEFFASISISILTLYFSLSYLGKLNFSNYEIPISLFSGFLILILAPEFFQPLRDLGAYYHAKAQAISAAEFLVTLLDNITQSSSKPKNNHPIPITPIQTLTITARHLEIFSYDNARLAGPLNFTISPNERIALLGKSGAGKSSLLNVLLGFLPYRGSLIINGIELKDLDMTDWRKQINWIGQNPNLPAESIIDNIHLSSLEASEITVNTVIKDTYINEFTKYLPDGINTKIGENAVYLSMGEAQRIAIARALLNPCHLLLLDEPTASLDIKTEQHLMKTLNAASNKQTTLLVTHLLKETINYDQIWVMENGLIIEKGTYSTLSEIAGPLNTS